MHQGGNAFCNNCGYFPIYQDDAPQQKKAKRMKTILKNLMEKIKTKEDKVIIENGVTIIWTDSKRLAVESLIEKYIIKHRTWGSEHIQQSDEPYIECVDLVSNIVDVIEPEVE